MEIKAAVRGIEPSEVKELSAWITEKAGLTLAVTNEGMTYREERPGWDPPDVSFTRGKPDKRDPWSSIVREYAPAITFTMGLLGVAAGKLAEVIVKELIAYYGERRLQIKQADTRFVNLYDGKGKVVRKVRLTISPTGTTASDDPLPSDRIS